MKSIRGGTIAILTVLLSVSAGTALAAQDKYSVKVPGGLSFAEFRGYETWEVISVSQGAPGVMAAIMVNPTMIAAYKAGYPGNGKPWPDGSKMAKVHYTTKKLETFPAATVADAQHDVDFMVKDSKRFGDSGGWGWAAFEYNPATKTFTPADSKAVPPQGNDAKCGFACHTVVKNRDYVFTDYHTK